MRTGTLALVLAYAALLVVAGVALGRRVRNSGDFFVAGRSLSTGLLCATLLAANIGAGSTVGATGLGYRYGLWSWWWSGSAALGSLLLGCWVAPRLNALAGRHGFLTLGDYLEQRYDRATRGLVGVVLWGGTLLILAGQLIAMAWALQVLVGVPRSWGCAAAGLVLVLYFSGGGLTAAAWINLLELVVLLVGFAVAVPLATGAAGGARELWAVPVPAMPAPVWLGLLLSIAPSFAVSPGLVQKTFAARSPRVAGRAVLWNALGLVLFAWVPALLGLAVRRLRPDLAQPEMALPVLFGELLPAWVGALGLVALFAAEISTADAVLFMLSTSLSRDLYQAFLRPQADDAELLRVGRCAAVGAGALGVALAWMLPTVVDALKAFYGVLTVALAAPLLVGLASPRPGPRQARAAVCLALATFVGGQWLWRATPHVAWLPCAVALLASLLVLASRGFRR